MPSSNFCGLTLVIRGFVVRIAVAALVCMTATVALAQAYPVKPIRLIIPYAPGSLADAVPRTIQSSLEERLGQRIVIEHRPGAGGNIGAQAVLAAPADGYTLMMAATNNLVINQFLYANIGFDPLRDFIPVSLLVDVPLMITVNPALPAINLKEFIDYAKANPGKLNYASPSTGTIPHLATELLSQALGIRTVHVPYKGGAPATTALLANDVQFMFIGVATLFGQIKGGTVRPIAVSGNTRLTAVPNVPTFAEAGFRDLDIPGNWWGLVAPKGTERAIVERLAAAVRAAVNEPEARKRYQDIGLTPIGSTPAEFAAPLAAQAAKWEKVIRQLGVKAE